MTRTDSRVDVSERPWKVVLKADEPLDYSVTSKYLKIVEEEDKHKFESVADTADKTIVFIGLFSAAVAVLVAVSIQDLSPSSQFYLANIYQLLAEPTGNVSQFTPPPPLTSPLPFSPPPHAIWVNSLWFLSLSISLVCGALVTLQQHWIHSYMMITQASQIPPRRRARIHAFRLRTMDSGVFMAIDITSVLIHTSLFLFFIGLLIYLFNINHTLFCAVAWFLGISAAAYLIVSLMPLYRIDSPYGSPLSFLLLWPFSGALYAILRILKSVIPAGNIASEHFHRLKTIYSEGFATAFLKSALKPSPNIECQIMDRTIDIMDDRELEWAFERFCDFSSSSSAVVSSIRYLAKSKWSSALEAFSDITFSSDSLLESDRIRRLGLCMMVADLAQLPNAGLHILRQIFDRQHPVLQSIGMGDILRRWNRSNQEIGFCTQILVSGIIANVRNRDDRWVVLASNLLGKSEDEVRGYRDSGDGNVLLANLIHITRQIIRSWKNGQGEAHDLFAYMFRSLSNFDIRNTLPELQDDFLTLWNGIDHTEIRDDLRNLRDVLTQGRDNALAAPPAPDSNLPGHPPDSISLHPRPPSPVASHPTAEPVARRQATVTPVNTPDISSRGQSTVADSTSSHGTSPANLPHSPSPVPGHPTSHPGNGAPPGGASDRSLSQPVAPPAMSPSPPEALERHGAIPGNIADTSSRGQPGSGTESSRASSSVPQSVPSPAASQVASVSDRNGAIIAPLNMHHVPAT